MKHSVTVGAQLLWSGRYGCNNGRYGCTIVMSYIEKNKAVSQWLLTFNLCVSVTWPLTCAFHIPCTHTPEIIDMHRGMCDNIVFLGIDLAIIVSEDTIFKVTVVFSISDKSHHIISVGLASINDHIFCNSPCCLTAPSSCMNYRWLIVREVLWHSVMGNIAGDA